MRLLKAAPAALVSALAFAAAAQTPRPTNRPPTVKLTASSSRVVTSVGCDRREPPVPACTPTASAVQLSAHAVDPDGNRLLYAYSTTGGRVTGDGPEATLDLTGVAPGVYKVTVKVDDGRGGVAFDEAAVTSERCICSEPMPAPPCPTVTVSCPDLAGPDGRLTFTAHVSGGDPDVTPTFEWKVEGANIVAGQGTSAVTLSLVGVYSGSLTGAVDVGGYESACQTSASCALFVGPPPQARTVDEYSGVVTFGDEKARLDNFYNELQNDPTAQAYLICYGGRRGRAGEARRRCGRAREHLVRTRRVDASRVVTVDGGRRGEPTIELWLVPSGAAPPTPAPTFFPKGRGRR